MLHNYFQSFTDFINGKQDDVRFRSLIEAKKDFMQNREFLMLELFSKMNYYKDSYLAFMPSGEGMDGVWYRLYRTEPRLKLV